MAAPAAGSFQALHPQLCLALHAGLDARGMVLAGAASLLPACSGGSASAPLGERNQAPPFELECELDLAAMVSPGCWAPEPHADADKALTLDLVHKDLEPLLLAARRSVALCERGAARSAALTLQTLADSLFINSERFGLRGLADWRRSAAADSSVNRQAAQIVEDASDSVEADVLQLWGELEELLATAWGLIVSPAGLASKDLAVLTQWADAWTRSLDPASTWSDHRQPWLARRGLTLFANSVEVDVAAEISLGWPVDGPAPLPVSAYIAGGLSATPAAVALAETVRAALLSLTYAQLATPTAQIIIDELEAATTRAAFCEACCSCGGVPVTFGEAERPAGYRWHGLFAVATGFGGGFESVGMRESGMSHDVRHRRWVQMLQLEWRPAASSEDGGAILLQFMLNFCSML